MDSRRSKILAVSLAVLALASVALYLTQSVERPRSIEQNDFALAETENVNRVQLLRASDTVDLTFDGRWQVNNQWAADVQMIKVLMATLQQVTPHRPVAAAQQDSALARIQKTGTRVKVMEGDSVVRDFWVGGNTNKSEAWFLGADNRAIVMIIPGYRVYVSGIFELPAGGWRNKRIFDFNWQNFKSLKVTIAGRPYDGYTVELKQRNLSIRGMDEVDTTKLNDFLDGVSLLTARRFFPSTKEALNSLSDFPDPLVKIEVSDVANRTWSLELFVPGPNRNEQLGRVSDGHLVIFDREDVRILMKSNDYYRK